MRSQRLTSPAAQAAQTGWMPRISQCRTGIEHGRGVPVRRAVADDLVAGHERERHDGLEVARRVAVDGGQVGAADAGEAGPERDPAVGGQLGRVEVAQPEGPDQAPAPGRDAAGDVAAA